MTDVKIRYSLIGATIGVAYFTTLFVLGFGYFTALGLKPFVYYVVLTPLLEEYIFRAVLQVHLASKFNKRFGIISVANILTSFIFALSHLVYSDPLHVVAVFFPSLLFGYFYEKSGSLLPCIVTHAIFNMNIFVVYRSDILSKIF